MYHAGSCRQSVPVRVKEELTVVSQERQEEKADELEQVRQGVVQDIALEMFIYLVMSDKCYHSNLIAFI
jgi:hypothetical protein